MLAVMEDRGHANGGHRSFDVMAERRPLTFELLPNHVSYTSATFVIYRAKVFGGWLVATRPSDNLTFIPDPQHEWDGGSLA